MAVLSILLTVIIVAVSVLIVMIVLLQRPKQEGLGAAFGGSTLDSALGAHTTDILQKITTWLGIIFFVSAIGLAMVKSRQFRSSAANDVLEEVQNREPVMPQLPASISDLPQTAEDPAGDDALPLVLPAPMPAETSTPEKPKSDAAPAAGDKGKGKEKAAKQKAKAKAKSSAPAPATPAEPDAPKGDSDSQ